MTQLALVVALVAGIVAVAVVAEGLVVAATKPHD